ncbi:MAG: hypothetical protein JXA91_07025 [Candidatus Thermoplasmatota archaeon]|nr:hypothetical protein [Candidatus Thermoplasmatota archaeon]
MKRIKSFLFCCIAISLLVISGLASSETIEAENHKIVISKNGDAISVKETVTIRGNSQEYYDLIYFSVSSEAENINVLIQNSEVSFSPDESKDKYQCNISSFGIPQLSSIQLVISYSIPSTVKIFEKAFLRNSTNVTVTFNEKTIFSGTNLKEGNSFRLLLYEPTEAPISWYIVISIALLVILLAVTTIYSFRKQKTTKIKEISYESEELLQTKKSLLMSLLKDLEKQHRAKKISDETHNKLKEHYKQQAVETMRKIDDIKSEGK